MRTFSNPFAPYNSQISSKSYNRPGRKPSLTVSALVNWATYTVGGAFLGNSNPNFSVVINLNSAQTNVLGADWQINSVYVDNEGVNFPVYIRFPDTGFTVPVQPNCAGWFPVVTAARSAVVTALGMTDRDIAQLATTNIFFSDEARIPYLDPEQQTAVEYGVASQTIVFGSGGSGISSVVPIPGGSGYTSNSITVSGAGGTGAVLTGTRDVYGRFTSVAVTAPGSGYTAAPSLTPPAQSAPAAWVATGYAANTVVQYGGRLYRSNVVIGGGGSGTPPPGNPSWDDPNLTVNATAVFQVAMTAASGGLSTTTQSNFGPRALGDQAKNYLDDVASTGVFRTNLWGTPYNSGSVILTSMNVDQLGAGTTAASTWQIEDTAGNQFMPFRNSTFRTLVQLSNCNLRLPATSSWQLRCTSYGGGGPLALAHAFTYTYNPNF